MATVDLSKKTVNLSKGEKINLSKSNETGLKSVMIGLGWDPAEDGFIEREVTKEPGFIGKLWITFRLPTKQVLKIVME